MDCLLETVPDKLIITFKHKFEFERGFYTQSASEAIFTARAYSHNFSFTFQ